MDYPESKENEEAEGEVAKPAIILKLKTSRFSKLFGCSVCSKSYREILNLKYHIRRAHYNLRAKISNRNKREINEVWLEKVINSDSVIEMKKTGANKYLMKRSDIGCHEITESTESLDLTPLYPIGSRVQLKKIWCCVCKRKFLKSNYQKHLEENHEDY